MILDDVVTLIREEITANAAGDSIATEHRRQVYVGVKSIGATRKIEAEQMGLKLAYKFVLADPAEYQGEQILEYQGQRLNIISDYVNENFEVELTTKRF